MTTFAFDFDHATALSTDIERAAANIREPAPPAVYARQSADFARTEVSPGQHECWHAGYTMRLILVFGWFAMLAWQKPPQSAICVLDDAMVGGVPVTSDASGSDEVSR